MLQQRSRKWRHLLLLAAAELLAMALWFSASAVAPQLTAEWGLSGTQQAWLTMSVQLGFVVGALVSAALNLADRLDSRYLFAGSALLGALATAAIAYVDVDVTGILALRFLTGVTLAGVYPPGMKLMATWCREDRGLGIGLLVGALTLGSARPCQLIACQHDQWGRRSGFASGPTPYAAVGWVVSSCQVSNLYRISCR